MGPGAIGFGTADGIGRIAGKRGDRQCSAGQQEIAAALTEAFSGADTVVRGNCTFGMFPNHPENVDDALRQRAGPRFTGRAIKNVSDAVKVRAMGFELPDERMERPDLLLFGPYEEKMAMIRGPMVPIIVGMVIRLVNRYADSEFRHADRSDEAAIEAMVRDTGHAQEAKRRYLEGKG